MCTLKKGLFLYSFREGWTASKEESDYLKRHVDSFDKDDFRKKSESFGTIVLESNRNLDLKTVYDFYDSRWLIELVFRYYKNSLDLDQAGEQQFRDRKRVHQLRLDPHYDETRQPLLEDG